MRAMIEAGTILKFWKTGKILFDLIHFLNFSIFFLLGGVKWRLQHYLLAVRRNTDCNNTIVGVPLMAQRSQIQAAIMQLYKKLIIMDTFCCVVSAGFTIFLCLSGLCASVFF